MTCRIEIGEDSRQSWKIEIAGHDVTKTLLTFGGRVTFHPGELTMAQLDVRAEVIAETKATIPREALEELAANSGYALVPIRKP